MSARQTLAEVSRALTVEALGTEADSHDLEAYRQALARAWPHPAFGENDEVWDLLERVLDGRVGRDEHGRDWVQVAATTRTP